MGNEKLLALKNISKNFGGIKALQNVSLSAYKGEVLSVVGENGAGKSTLMKIIAGVLKPDEGDIYFEQHLTEFRSPEEASHKGISIVYQEPNIFSQLTVLENMFLGEEIKNKFGNIDWKKMHEEASKALEMVDLSPTLLEQNMDELSIGNQQLVLIAKGLYKESKLLILDEPTSILSQTESEKLFALINEIKLNGVSILYISHRIPEILSLSDQIVVLRDGRVTEYLDPSSATESKIISAMSGREINLDIYRPRNYERNKPLLKVEKLSNHNYFEDISFQIKPGEILGMYGLIGSGRSEVARTIFGEMPIQSGSLLYEDELLTNHSMKKAVANDIYYVPEDRGTQGIFSFHNIKYNLSAVFLPYLSRPSGILNNPKETKTVQDNIEKYSIKTNSQDTLITSLSGGNQQKVLLTRWLLRKPKLIILDEPTRGIDMGTKTEIHELVIQLAENNVSVLLISSDLPEIMRLADRVIVMHKGETTGIINRKNMTEESILRLALGLS